MTAARPLFARLNWYLVCQFAGWGGVSLFILSYGIMGHLSMLFVAVCLWGLATGMLFSELWRRFLKRRAARLRRTGWPVLLAGIIVLAFAQTAAMTAGYAIFRPFGGIRGWSWAPNALLFWFGVYLTWTIIYLAVLTLRRATRAEAEALRLELHAKDVELRALQAQVNPHFFFNSMNSVRALIYENPESAARMIDQLAGLMRYALQSGQADTVPLRAELEAVEAYLDIEKIRFEERLRVQIAIDSDVEEVKIPPMSLQTLVENAVKYGVEMSATGSDIRIGARREAGKAVIEIANVGAIVPFTNSTQVGLTNTRKRLALSMGSEASLDLRETDGWVRATLQVPA
ncbi:sensor histidine kinase [Massilia endophytica]|uniref:sensor histidine kinase n=1 Tax=Massilia endophytica TaxID=2899220 RepID=UPI001E5E3296|nr:histidine kinase [Massilia endophytica]UGQ47682.1 histidine kinase [Massilia endophytica]